MTVPHHLFKQRNEAIRDEFYKYIKTTTLDCITYDVIYAILARKFNMKPATIRDIVAEYSYSYKQRQAA